MKDQSIHAAQELSNEMMGGREVKHVARTSDPLSAEITFTDLTSVKVSGLLAVQVLSDKPTAQSR